MTDVLSKEQVAACLEGDYGPEHLTPHSMVVALCDSHEALRAEVARLTEELRQMRECPMILCPFEEENVKLRAELAARDAERTE